MSRFEPVLQAERPDLVVAVGDVNSTLACALTAAKPGISVANVEAGLRSFDRTMPEEINRVLTDTLADYLFTTERSANINLLREGIPPDKIHFVGNIMIETLLRQRHLPASSAILSRLELRPRVYTLLTLHRPSNMDDRGTFQAILAALNEIGQEVPIVFPCNPRTRKQIDVFGLWSHFAGRHPADRQGIHLVEPLGYLDFLQLMSQALLVLTDSGGIQEDTTVLGVPCLTLRKNTEQPVTVTQGTNTVVGTDPQRIASEAHSILRGKPTNGRVPELWDGRTAPRILEVLQGILSRRPEVSAPPGVGLPASGSLPITSSQR